MRRGWRPVLVGGAVAAATFVLAQAQIFAPAAPAAGSASSGDVYRGETVFQRECAGCHGPAGEGGSGPQLQGSQLASEDVTSRVRQGTGVMPPALVTGQEETDVVAYVVSISTP